MKFTKLLAAFLLVSGAAMAQTAPAPTGPAAHDASENLIQDWQVFVGTQRHVAESIGAIVQENRALKEENAQLKAELDKAGSPASAKN